MMSQSQGAAVPVSTRVPQWPPKQTTASASHSSWLARCANNSGRQVEWPPRFEDQYGSQPTLNSSYLSNSRDKVSEPRPLYSSLRKLPGDDQPNLTTFYPSNFKLRSEMPVEQQGSQVVVSQPAFKMTKPMKMRGDNKWPPAADGEVPTQEEVREFIKPRKQTKDYSGFFAKHSLPANYTGYRAPPGTQHVGAAEDEGASDM